MSYYPMSVEDADDGSGMTVRIDADDLNMKIASSKPVHELVTLDFDGFGNLVQVEIAARPKKAS